MAKPFQFRGFSVEQDAGVFKVGTDGTLLALMVELTSDACVLEVGSGTGFVSLLLAERFPSSTFDAIDINARAAELTARNFDDSPFSERLSATEGDFFIHSFDQKFSAIVCNPPFFKTAEKYPGGALRAARQQWSWDFEPFFVKCQELCSAIASLHLVVPFNQYDELVGLAKSSNWFLTEAVSIKAKAAQEPNRLVLSFSKLATSTFEKRDFVIREANNSFTEQYLELAEAFFTANLRKKPD
ncbi:methyltransferase [Chitinophagales bacterium]|nr:methyltransferase [Chitinophagales bacterium]